MQLTKLFNRTPPAPVLCNRWDALTVRQYTAACNLSLWAGEDADFAQRLDELCSLLAILSNWQVSKTAWLELPPAAVERAVQSLQKGDILKETPPFFWEGKQSLIKDVETLSTGAAILMHQAIAGADQSDPFGLWVSLLAIWLQWKDGQPADEECLPFYLLQAEELNAKQALPAAFFLQKASLKHGQR